jgi:hypothetical protein
MRFVYEMRPREGNWHPAYVLVPEAEYGLLKVAFKGARGKSHAQPAMFQFAEETHPDGKGANWKGWRVDDQIDSTTALYARFKSKPSKILFGSQRQNYFYP